jgi:NAD-dependent dihydropyrimidine dehydrogenase PreA subunit
VKTPRKKKKNNRSSSNRKISEVSIYLSWCKRCGNCVAFCPVKALELDEWGYPQMCKPERCTGCRMCEMLCPDFAISVSEAPPSEDKEARVVATRKGSPGALVNTAQSPERIGAVSTEQEESSD